MYECKLPPDARAAWIRCVFLLFSSESAADFKFSVIARVTELFEDKEVWGTPYFSSPLSPDGDLHDIAYAFGECIPNRHNIRLFLDANAGTGRLRLHPRGWFGNNLCKEADVSILASGRHDYPSVVAEVGYNQSISELRQDTSEWLALSSEIKLVILIKIYKSDPSGAPTRSIQFEFWERDRDAAGTPIQSPVLPPLTWQTVDDVSEINFPATYFFDGPLPDLFLGDASPCVTLSLDAAQHWFELVVVD
ncbi:hypothetical protein B0H19DRAFT_1257257 [Mycena capillaripes]|nr:hypothetical protein B0H19DRAFT_1257257 [Mycena capillaripes]